VPLPLLPGFRDMRDPEQLLLLMLLPLQLLSLPRCLSHLL
jgi:hypothetical protein